jgi:hypothetical protein
MNRMYQYAFERPCSLVWVVNVIHIKNIQNILKFQTEGVYISLVFFLQDLHASSILHFPKKVAFYTRFYISIYIYI